MCEKLSQGSREEEEESLTAKPLIQPWGRRSDELSLKKKKKKSLLQMRVVREMHLLIRIAQVCAFCDGFQKLARHIDQQFHVVRNSPTGRVGAVGIAAWTTTWRAPPAVVPLDSPGGKAKQVGCRLPSLLSSWAATLFMWFVSGGAN